MSKNKTKQEVTSVTVGSGTSTLPNRNNLIGQTISLNQKKEAYFGVGAVWLTAEDYYCEIPDGLDNNDYQIIADSLADGTIVLGKQFIPPIDKLTSIREEYWQALKSYGIENKDVRNKFTVLLRKNQDRGWTAFEIAEYCLQKEQGYKKRSREMTLLSQIIDNWNGPKVIYDTHINDLGENMIEEPSPKRKTSSANKSDMPELPKESKEALNKLLGL